MNYPQNQVESMVRKIRALIEDFIESDFQVFTYGNSATFTMREPNIHEITGIVHNGTTLPSGEDFTFNKVNNKITLVGLSLTAGDTIEVDYDFHKYSAHRIKEYIRGALTWLSIFDYSTDTYQILGPKGQEFIAPDLTDPSNKTSDLICIITSILILPNYMHYRMPNLAVNYPEKMSREEKIRDIIQRYQQGVGIVDIIEWNRSPGL
jgi:hypothetical protein